jgi:hypothetical protein
MNGKLPTNPREAARLAPLTAQTVRAVCSLLESRGIAIGGEPILRDLLALSLGNSLLKAYRSGLAAGRRLKG